MKVKLTFKQLIDLVNLDMTNTGLTYENGLRSYPYPEGIVIEAEQVEETK